MTDYDVPVCWNYDWPLPELPALPSVVLDTADRLAVHRVRAAAIMAAIRDPEDELRDRLLRWQLNRCAVCGVEARLVEDHDHESGLTRGYLCGSCNLGEGLNRGRIFSLYRWRHPTSLLGLTIRYLDPFTREPVAPQPRWRPRDRFRESAAKGIGL